MKYFKYDIGNKLSFNLIDSNSNEISSNDFIGKWLILYFYPKDNTKGCTTEAIDFTNSLEEFKKLNAEVVGVSPDEPKKHIKFIEKHNLKVTLLSAENEVLNEVGVWQMKKMYGREYYGVMRTTVILNPNGVIEYVWEKVKVSNHIKEVLNKLIELQK
ncbi:peroxiredoxin [Tepiditoga spiralis]|uniref:thioredoxin-dependent peroxiredoxin n=1 Tax=Tepiditoga spiralis TaxID=2108365 RepID=A0A7G1G630_9BACT|nr:peroxiredoxin [Tepiditoga spiralis]BBE32060.1 peroxiredoxin [Tepiditoga spiralis]